MHQQFPLDTTLHNTPLVQSPPQYVIKLLVMYGREILGFHNNSFSVSPVHLLVTSETKNKEAGCDFLLPGWEYHTTQGKRQVDTNRLFNDGKPHGAEYFSRS
jgi:hypothetical protein